MDNCFITDTGNDGDIQKGKHKFDKEGYCIYCGIFKKKDDGPAEMR